MTKIIGRLASIGIGKESVRGTAVTPTYWIPWDDATIEDRVETVTDESSLGVIEDSDAMNVVSKFSDPSWTAKLKDDHIGLLLLSLLGAVSSAEKGGDAGVYDHTFSVQQGNQHQSLTVVYKDSNQDVAFPNSVIDSFSLNIRNGKYVTYDVSFQGKKGESDSNTVAHSQETDFVPQDLVFKRATTKAGLGAAGESTIRELTLNIEKNIIKEDVLGSVDPNDFLNQQLVITGSITAVYNNTDYQDLQDDETYQAFRIDLINSETIGASSNPELKIDLNRVRIENYEKNLSQNDLVEESFGFKAMYSLTDSESIEAILTNLITSY